MSDIIKIMQNIIGIQQNRNKKIKVMMILSEGTLITSSILKDFQRIIKIYFKLHFHRCFEVRNNFKRCKSLTTRKITFAPLLEDDIKTSVKSATWNLVWTNKSLGLKEVCNEIHGKNIKLAGMQSIMLTDFPQKDPLPAEI